MTWRIALTALAALGAVLALIGATGILDAHRVTASEKEIGR